MNSGDYKSKIEKSEKKSKKINEKSEKKSRSLPGLAATQDPGAAKKTTKPTPL